MAPKLQQYCVEKKGLRSDALTSLLDDQELRQRISDNVNAALDATVVKSGQGIFGHSNYRRSITFDGAITTKRDPAQSPYSSFFKIPGRLSKKADRFVLRGPSYLISINPTFEVRQKLRILKRDFRDAVHCTESSINQASFFEQSAVLDYAKNAAITLLNAIVQREKLGQFRLDNLDYQLIRRNMLFLAGFSTRAYYAHMIGREEDLRQNIFLLRELLAVLDATVEYIEREYEEGIFSSRYFTRPEASHPLVILGAIYSAVVNVGSKVHSIVALPSGGTEIGLAQQYAYRTLTRSAPNLTLLPLSMHTIKSEFDKPAINEDGFREYLVSRRRRFDSRCVLIVEDNCSTGRTISAAADLIAKVSKPKSIHVSVAEADMIRSQIDRESLARTHVAAPAAYQYSVNILPVSRHIAPKTDLKELAEKSRLAHGYRRLVRAARSVREKILYDVFLEMVVEPTVDVLASLSDDNAILSFRHTFLSNFFITQINHGGRAYPSVEHAYQAQKFAPGILAHVTPDHLERVERILTERGRVLEYKSMEFLFQDRNMSAGHVKVVADCLRRCGYARDDWDDRKIPLMIDLLQKKFRQDALKERLLATGDKYLVEVNTWDDTLWGICNKRGRNLLGLILMNLRKRYSKKTARGP